MKKITGLALVAVLTMSLLAGCAEDGMIGQAERDGRNVIEEGAQDAKNAANDAKNAVEDAADDTADATGDMMENAQGMMMAAGSRIQDVIMELEENLGITMPEKLDQQSLQEVFGLNPDDIEEYYGEYSAVNTSADHIIGVKVKDGKVDEVKSALESHKQEIVDISEKIGTYETSVLPYEDCCTIFVAKHPVTKPNLNVIKCSERHLDDVIDEMMERAVSTAETIEVC